jgi:hypothetical protein
MVAIFNTAVNPVAKMAEKAKEGNRGCKQAEAANMAVNVVYCLFLVISDQTYNSLR